jgi:hypothetical protein
MSWVVRLHEDFEPELAQLAKPVRREVLAHMALLREYGPQLGRPWADTLKGSEHPNMKELRFKADKGVWRVTFAFDTRRQAIVLLAGNKTGVSQARFYRQLIEKSDERFSRHLAVLKQEEK